jgi:hypothetical protein
VILTSVDDAVHPLRELLADHLAHEYKDIMAVFTAYARVCLHAGAKLEHSKTSPGIGLTRLDGYAQSAEHGARLSKQMHPLTLPDLHPLLQF